MLFYSMQQGVLHSDMRHDTVTTSGSSHNKNLGGTIIIILAVQAGGLRTPITE